LHRLLNDNQKNWQALRDIAVLKLYYEKDPQTARRYGVSALHVVKDRLERGVLEVPYPERVVADIRALVGLCLLAEGNADVAQTLAMQALEEDDDCFRAHNVFGLLYIQQGKTVQAMRSLCASLRLKPDQPEIKRWLEDAFNRRSRVT
jgi:Tfp pilus assembly protein PilF